MADQGTQAPETAARRRGTRKVRTGVVVSDKMDKTVVVKVTSVVRHPLYGKTVRRSKKFKAHDEGNQARQGDVVRIMETRPLSKTKRWRVVEIVERAK
ncbi:MAG TPA: 30S ribosomal protein S17 [Actinomycetota bacterium]|nr:30S ribosomal protein S17 [Actinomycetota bacterium]